MYGVTIKKLRLGKRLTIKAVYANVCSKTNAIKFEQGKRNLKIDKFVAVLAHLSISADEFLWIHHQYHPSSEKLLEYKLGQLWNQGATTTFKDQVQQLQEKQQLNPAHLASYRLLVADAKRQKHDPKSLQTMINYFTYLNFWTLEDIKYFANNCYLLPYPLVITLLKEALRAQDRYTFFKHSDLLRCTLLAKCIGRMLKAKDFKNARYFLRILTYFSPGIPMDSYRLLSKYYAAKIDFDYLNPKRGKQKLFQCLQAATYLDNQQLVHEIKDDLNK